jgi:serine-type D-Ala-D-Ala carboxypeptidase/endopeptidase (penicillin-binding protein 4)
MDNKFSIDLSTKEQNSYAEVLDYSPSYKTQTISLNVSVLASGTEDQAVVYGDPFSYNKSIKGTIPPNKKHFQIEAALPDPALLCAEALCFALKSIGVKCNSDQAQSRYTYIENGEQRQFLFSHFSPYLDNIIHFTNLKSVNLFSESLLRVLGKGDMQKGIEEVKNYWQSRGLDLTSLNMKDGSGLARSNSISPALLSRVMSKIYNDTENYKNFVNSLPVAGRSGSMSTIGKGRFIENNLHAKTGYMERVRAYTGYVKAKSGKDLAFTLIVNNYTCTAKEMKIKIEKFLNALEAY